MVSGFDSQDGVGSGDRPCRRIRHDRGACRGVSVAQRLPGCRPVDRCIAVDWRLTVNPGADDAEPWQWLGHDELPEYVGDRLSDAAEAAGLEVRTRQRARRHLPAFDAGAEREAQVVREL